MSAGAISGTPSVGGTRALSSLKMIALGDSLTAGMQDANIDKRSQDMAYPRLVANQAGIPFNMPEVDGLGIPPNIFLKKDVDLPRTVIDYAEVAAATAGPLGLLALGIVPPKLLLEPMYCAGHVGHRTEASKDTPKHPQSNFAVPGFELRHLSDVNTVQDYLKEVADGATRNLYVPVMSPLIHSVLQNDTREDRGSEVDQAIAQNPDIVVLWAGNNDALETVAGGVVDDRVLTPMQDKKWEYWDQDLVTGTWSLKQTKTVQPGFATSMNKIVGRLENETRAEIMLFNVPDVTSIPFVRTVGEKVGELPFKIVLPDGSDVTQILENRVIPDEIRGAGKGGRTVFPPGTRVGLSNVLISFVTGKEPKNLAEFLDALQQMDLDRHVFTENDVLDPDEIATISARIGQYNGLMNQLAAANPRVHVVDANGILATAQSKGIELKGAGSDKVVVTNTFTGTTDSRGYGGFFGYDGIHPTDVGHAILGNALLQKIQQDLGPQDKFKGFQQVPLLDEKAFNAQDPHRMRHQSKIVLNLESVEAMVQSWKMHLHRG